MLTLTDGRRTPPPVVSARGSTEERKGIPMAKMTIAQLREREVDRLAHFHAAEPTEEDYQTARRLMNSFYRLCGLAETNLYLSNDERRCNTIYTQKSERRESIWHERLSKQFKDFAGLELVYCGYAPSIGVRCYPGGGFSEKINRWFYN